MKKNNLIWFYNIKIYFMLIIIFYLFILFHIIIKFFFTLVKENDNDSLYNIKFNIKKSFFILLV